MAAIKAGEQQATGLHLLHLVNSDLQIVMDSMDIEVLNGLLRQAVAHRDRSATGSWYFHLRDLGTWSVLDPGEDGLNAITRLKRWKEDVEKEFLVQELEWMTPSEIRARRLQNHD